MSRFKRYISKLFSALKLLGVLKDITEQNSFPDEPVLNRFNIFLKSPKNFSDGGFWEGSASGFSFDSREFALFKCMMEAAERLSNTRYKKRQILYKSFNQIKNIEAVEPTLFLHNPDIKKKTLGWVKGVDFLSNKPSLIPAQAIYFSYRRAKDEPILTELISTGAAGGLDYESTLLRGIYEIVERDCFMTVYLNKIRAPKIDLQHINDAEIQAILEKALRYNLEVKVFDITNDLGIPSFLTILIDRTGLGPSVTLGLKSSFSIHGAIVGSIEESFHVRPWLRQEVLKRQNNRFLYKKSQINSILDRGLFWLSPLMLPHLNFLLDQEAKKIKIPRGKISAKEELERLKTILKQKNIKVYFVDIGIKAFKDLGLFFYKVTIPQLQPLYLHETHREIRMDRLKTVAKYFGLKKVIINQIPHPFL